MISLLVSQRFLVCLDESSLVHGSIDIVPALCCCAITTATTTVASVCRRCMPNCLAATATCVHTTICRYAFAGLFRVLVRFIDRLIAPMNGAGVRLSIIERGAIGSIRLRLVVICRVCHFLKKTKKSQAPSGSTDPTGETIYRTHNSQRHLTQSKTDRCIFLFTNHITDRKSHTHTHTHML